MPHPILPILSFRYVLDENAEEPEYVLQDNVDDSGVQWALSDAAYTKNQADWTELLSLVPHELQRSVTSMEVDHALRVLSNPAKYVLEQGHGKWRDGLHVSSAFKMCVCVGGVVT